MLSYHKHRVPTALGGYVEVSLDPEDKVISIAHKEHPDHTPDYLNFSFDEWQCLVNCIDSLSECVLKEAIEAALTTLIKDSSPVQ